MKAKIIGLFLFIVSVQSSPAQNTNASTASIELMMT